MPVVLVVLGALAVWVLAAAGTGVLIGRMIKLGEDSGPAVLGIIDSDEGEQPAG